MVKCSNFVITLLNVLTTLLALSCIGYVIYMHFVNGSPSHCQRVLEWPLLLVGLALLMLSLIGLVGSACRVTPLLWIYLVVLVVLIIGWFVFSVFVFLVTNKGAGAAVSGVGYKEYKLGDYSHWLQKHVVNGKNWDGIRSCLVETKMCESLDDVYLKKGADFLKSDLTPIQSGCCKPPSSCGFTSKNATYWEISKDSSASSETDCKAWSNDKNKLCYDCQSCKAGVLANLRNEWRSFSILNVIVLVVLMVVYVLGCCAVHNDGYDRSPKYRPNYAVRPGYYA